VVIDSTDLCKLRDIIVDHHPQAHCKEPLNLDSYFRKQKASVCWIIGPMYGMQRNWSTGPRNWQQTVHYILQQISRPPINRIECTHRPSASKHKWLRRTGQNKVRHFLRQSTRPDTLKLSSLKFTCHFACYFLPHEIDSGTLFGRNCVRSQWRTGTRTFPPGHKMPPYIFLPRHIPLPPTSSANLQ